MGLLFTFLLGIFIIIGALIVFLTKNSDRFIKFSICVAFGVMVSLIIGDLLPETFELLLSKYSFIKSFLIVLICNLLGITILKTLDLFIPDHDSKEEETHLEHIGLVSSIALILHNIIEGMAVYSTVTKSFKLGIFLSIGVGLHNIPLGMVIASTLYKANNSKKKTISVITLISLSTFIGGVIMHFLNFSNDIILGIFLSITMGMLFYITLFELFPKIKEYKNKKKTILSILLGTLVLLVSFILE